MNNFVCIPDAGEGCVHALFCNLYHRAYHMVSDDDGLTWSRPVDITPTFEAFRDAYAWTICAVGPGHGIQHSSGRLIATIWLSLGTRFHLPNRAGAIYSDDHGATWHAGGLLPEEPPNTNEATAVELADGRVMLNVRCHSERHRRLVTVSPDGRGDWDEPRFSDSLVDPICHASICRYDRETLIFSNPDALTRDLPGCWEPVCDRRNLTVRASKDDGVSWPLKRVLEPGPAGYSDLAVLPDKTILCVYEDGMQDRMADTARLTIARFGMDWLAEGAV
jgi:sialidase-1